MKDYLMVRVGPGDPGMHAQVVSTNTDDPKAVLERFKDPEGFNYMMVYELARPNPVLAAEAQTMPTWVVE